MRRIVLTLFCVVALSCSELSTSLADTAPFPSHPAAGIDFLEQLQEDTFAYFWETTDPDNGLAPDHVPDARFASIAAVGFALTSYLVGVEREYVSRADAARRTLATLRFLWKAPQGDAVQGMAGNNGFFYHFLGMRDGRRFGNSELSTIDTALLMAGVLSAATYFDRHTDTENRIRAFAEALYRRVDWPRLYCKDHRPLLSMGWDPEGGMIKWCWRGYNEGMLLYILALGSPTHPIDPAAWDKWTETYLWQDHYGYEHVNFGPLFGHQYSHVWIDFRNIQDRYMRSKGIDYFINSRRATYANRSYCIANPGRWIGYGGRVWGLTASNGPARITISEADRQIAFFDYLARGTSAGYLQDDGTIAPTAAGGSLAFAPEIALPTLRFFKSRFGEKLYGKYGFKDAFNLSFCHDPDHPSGWYDSHYLGIDQGPILLMAENLRSGFVWRLVKGNPYIRKGLRRAGFSGGWLEAD